MNDRRGFTLIEIMVALVILTVVVLGLATAAAQVIHIVTLSDRDTAALQLADSRIETIQMDPDYYGLDTTYVATETDFPTLPGYTRQTEIAQFGGLGQTLDHKKITVTVTGPGLAEPVTRSITVAAP